MHYQINHTKKTPDFVIKSGVFFIKKSIELSVI